MRRKRYTVVCRGRKLALGVKTRIMGILNVTNDSFSDGGLFYEQEPAIRRGLEMAREGADIIDVGGESTRPGAKGIPAGIQIKRTAPVIKEIASRSNVLISIDTSSAEVARAALEAGAAIVNDITGLRGDKGIAGVIAGYKAGCVIMHIRGSPRTMQRSPRYHDLLADIRKWLKAGMDLAQRAGIAGNRIILDPGIGFGKTVRHNLRIIKDLSYFAGLQAPILIGTSRKSFIGKTLNLDVKDRLIGTAASVAHSVINGAHIVRVHDVKEMSQAVRLTDAVLNS